MKLLVLGATGPTGRLVIEAAVRHGDDVTALVRRPDAADQLPDGVHLVVGDATSTDDVATAMTGQDAVISALGRGTSIRAENLFTRAATAVVDAATRTGVTRLVWMSSFGVGATYASANVVQKIMYRTFLRDIYANKKLAEQRIRASAVDWTIVYPTALTHGPATADYRVGERLDMPLAARISRADVADFMHKAAHDREWSKRDAVLSS